MAYWSKKYKKFPYAKHVKHDGGKKIKVACKCINIKTSRKRREL